jgi:iron complex outermembrane receptor protein
MWSAPIAGTPERTGRYDFTAAYNHNKTTRWNTSDNPAMLTANGLTADRPPDHQPHHRRLAEGQAEPVDRLHWADWSARGVVTRYGSFTVPQNNATLDQAYDPQWVLDVSGSVKLGKNWRVSPGVSTT